MANFISYKDFLDIFEHDDVFSIDETYFYFDDETDKGHYIGCLREYEKPYWAGYCDIPDGTEFSTAYELFNAKIYDGCSLKDRWDNVVIEMIGGICTEDWLEIYKNHFIKNNMGELKMKKYDYVTLREKPELREKSAKWFSSKWGVPEEAYLECMDAYLSGETEYGWYMCLDGDKIIGGMGVIENDFHDRKDLSPNVCAVYTDEEYRCQGIAGNLLNMVVDDMKAKGITPIYLVTDHTGFYERYGWEFFCMVQGDGEPDMTRMYIHR